MQIKEITNRWSTTNVRRGIVRDLTMSDELDSCTVVLPHVSKLDIEADDIVQLTNEFGGLEYWCVASYERTFVTKTAPFIYDYTINLMDCTKLFEGIDLPNMTITSDDNQLQTYKYMQIVFEYYFKTNYENVSLTINPRLTAIFSELAPSCSFGTPTLREYLDFLMETKGYISKLVVSVNNGTIEFMLSFKRLNSDETEAFPTEYVDQIVQSQSADDYVSCLNTDATDIVSPDTVVEIHKLKSEAFINTSDNAKLILDHKAYDLKSVKVIKMGSNANAYYSFGLSGFALYRYDSPWTRVSSKGGYIYIDVYPNTGSTSNMEVVSLPDDKESNTQLRCTESSFDITSNVLLSAIYQAKTLLAKGKMTDARLNESTLYQNEVIRWDRGSRNIDGFNTYQTKTNIIGITSSDDPAIQYAYVNAHDQAYLTKELDTTIGDSEFPYRVMQFSYQGKTYILLGSDSSVVYWDNYDTPYEYDEAIFEVEYQPYVDMRIKNIREQRHYFEMNNSSSNASTDIRSFFANATEKNKQLGNDMLSFYGNSDTTSIRFKVGQYYDVDDARYILNKLEYTFKQNLITYKGTLTKNYSNRNISTILNREKRYYSLPDESEAVTRHEIIVQDYKSTWKDSIFTGRYLFATVWTKSTTDDSKATFVGCVPVSRIKLDDSTYQFKIKMEDNAELGYYVSDDVVTGTELKQTKFRKYTDDYGVCTYFAFTINSYTLAQAMTNTDYGMSNYGTDYLLPSLGSETSLVWRKDAKEKLEVTLQINNVAL